MVRFKSHFSIALIRYFSSFGNVYAAALLFYSSLAFGFDEPLERRTLTPVDSHKYPAGTCPGHPLTSRPVPPIALGTNEASARIRRDRDDYAGLAAARMIYALSDLETNQTGDAYVTGMRGFLQGVPEDYELYFLLADGNVGLKYMILRPTSASLKPWILAIAGTQTVLDWIMDLDLGRAQFAQMQKILRIFTTCQYLNDGFPLAGAQWIVSGHSLGGGLAQALAYEIQRRRIQAGMRPVDLRLVTFNAFGARQLIEKSANYDARVMPFLRATNYFVMGDEVSRIGEHIGPTLQLTPAGEDPATPPRLRAPGEIARRHGIQTVYEIASLQGRGLMSGLSFAEVRATPERKFLRSLFPAAEILSGLAFAALDEGNPERILSRLQANVASVEKLTRLSLEDRRIRQFTRGLLYSQIDAWDTESAGIMAKSRVAELKRMLKRLQ